jgi:DNA replication and repair protein RecF
MQVKKVALTNYRNYSQALVELSPGRNIVIGENAQGKTNFLESLEYVSHGSSWRASQDADLIKMGSDHMLLEVDYVVNGAPENIFVGMRRNTGSGAGQSNRQLEKVFKLNGLSQRSIKNISHRLVTVSFKSYDLNLLRSGPKFRRDWIDNILMVLRPQFKTVIANYTKVILQRNRLLKQLFEKGRLSVSDNDQMRAWDEQAAKFGAEIIKERIALINRLLPLAEGFQEMISGSKETLACHYLFKNEESRAYTSGSHNDDEGQDLDNEDGSPVHESVSSQELASRPHSEVVLLLMRRLKSLRFEEIRRKQTLVGPHRDDLLFSLNDADAVHFASQGQQRSLVLSLKLAELKLVTEFLNEPPLLLLDDVLAELDLSRQSLLMSMVARDMQTIITTTHVTGFQPEWLEGARFLEVVSGQIQNSDTIRC